MFNNVKAKKRLTQVIIAFVVICMTVTGSFLLLEDSLNSASAATKTVTMTDAASWNNAMNSAVSGDVITVNVNNDISLSAKLSAVKAGVTVNLNMNGKSIYWDTQVEGDASIMSTSYPPSANYWGLITNNGTLNITGTGTIRMKKINFNETNSGNQFDTYAARSATIVNSGTNSNLTIGSGITVQNYITMAFVDYDGSRSYADMFIYGCAIYNDGQVTTSGTIESGSMATGISESVTNSYNYAFSYGIYGGRVTTRGGKITSIARAGGIKSSASCTEGNHIVAIGVGIYSNTARLFGDTTVNTETATWMSAGSNDLWSGGDDISFSAGVMYLTTNYPVIGASVDINSTFICPGGDDYQAVIPGTDNLYYTVKNADAPGEYARRAYPVVGVQKNEYTIGSHGAESNWTQNGGFFGTGDPSGSNQINQYFNFNNNMYYYPEEAYYNGFTTNNNYRENASAQYLRDSGSNTKQTATSVIKNGCVGDAGTQYMIVYRYYNGSFTTANLQSVSPTYDSSKQNERAYLSIAGVTSNNNGSIDNATSNITFGGGGTSKNSHYYELNSITIERIPTATYGARSFDRMSDWSAQGSTLTSAGTSMTTENTLVVYMNYVLKSPSAIRVVADNAPIGQQTTTTDFTATYTGYALKPGTDFYLGIVDMGIHIAPDTDDVSDNTVVTDVYNISGTGSGSGNNATAVTYRYSADQSTWTNGLPKNVGSYWIEVTVNADTTFASSGTYNRQGTQAYITCTITKANITIAGPASKTGTYGSTYGELIPYNEYTPTGLGSDQLAGSWSYAGLNANETPAADQYTVHLVWTPTAGTSTANNYNATTYQVNLVVNKRAVNVNAGAAFVTYGDANPTYVLNYENLASCDDDMKTEWLNTSAFEIFYNNEWVAYSAGIPAGTYTLRISTFGGAADENNTFSVNTTEGQFTVQKRNIVYNAVAADRAYNGSAEVNVTLNYVSGNYTSDTYDAVINTVGTMVAGANAGTDKAVNVDTSLVTLKNSANYTLVIDNISSVTVNISKADPTGVSVVANPATITYDASKTLASSTTIHVTGSNVEGNWAWKDASIVPTVDVATYTAVFTPTDTVNYNPIEQAVTLTVEQAHVVVSVKDFTIAYGDAVPAISGSISYTGFTGADKVDTIAGVSGGTDATTTYTRGSGVGSYPITVVTTLTSTNYYFTSENSTITVSPKALKVTANSQSVTYGAAVPELDETDITVEGFYGTDNVASLGGTVSVSTTYVPGASVGSYPITVSGYTSDNYAIEYIEGALTVNRATLTVTPVAKSVTYGADAPAYSVIGTDYSLTGFVANDTVESVKSDISGDPVFTTGYRSGSNVGSYPVTVAVNAMSSTNYTFVGAEGTLTVNKATPIVEEIPGASVVNSHTFAEAVFDGTEVVVNPNKSTMNVAGTFAFVNGSSVPTWGSDGLYDAVFTPEDTTNYNTVNVQVILTITQKTISGTPVIQGSAMAGSTLTVSLASMDPTTVQYYTYQWYLDGVAIANATSTSYQVKDSDIGGSIHVVLVAKTSMGFSGTATSEKTAAVIEALLETTAAQLKVTLPSGVVYDAMSHEATVSIADGYNAQYFGDITIKYNGSTTLPVNAGTYIVTVDVGTPDMPAGGYPENTYYGPATGISVGTFEITRAPFTVTVLATDKVYDGTVTANATVTGSGAVDEMDDVRIAEGARFAFSDAKVGTDKAVNVASMQLIGAQAANYELVVEPATASITPATLKARANGVTKTYDGSTLVNVTFSNVEGYASVDSASTVYLTNGSAIAVSADAGTQALTNITYTLAGSSAANYVVEITNAPTVVITAATPQIDAPVISGIVYDSAKTLQTIDLAGYTTANGFWEFNDLTIVPTVSTKTYAATYKSTNKNYTDLATTITINVEPKAVILTADDKSVSYGSRAPVYTITASGFTGEDTLSDIGGSCTPVCTYAAGSDIGSYTINLNNALSDDNYTFTTVPGTLTVAPARLNVTAEAVNKVYDGTTNIRVNFTVVSGKYGNDDISLSSTYVTGQSATPNAGPTTVTYVSPMLVGSKADNYELYISPASGALTVEIAKADVAGVIFPVDGEVEFGFDLSYATFATPGVGDGTFAYENAKAIVPGALGLYTNYKVIFTPTDSRNYNTQEAYVALEVVECVLDYVVGVAGTPQSGQTLTVVTTGLPSMAVNYIQYQWYRVDGYEVSAIEGATGSSYVATDDDVGYTLVVITYFDELDPYVFSDSANVDSVDGNIEGIIGQTSDAIEELALSFWQRLLNWIRRIIAAITGVSLSGGIGG